MKVIAFVPRIAVLAVVALLCTTTAHAQVVSTAKDESSISSNGTAKVYRTPDFVDVVAGIEVQEKTASQAQQSASDTMAKMVAAVKGLKLAGEDLQSGAVQLRPEYKGHQYSDEIHEIVGYRAEITLRVRTTDIKAASRIIDAALGAGGNRVDSVEFGIKEAIEAREEAVRLAVKAAKRKAGVMAQALDLRLGRMIHASTSSNQYGSWSVNRYSNMTAQIAGGQSGGGSDDNSAVVPGKVEVWAEANLTFGVDETAK